MCSPSSALGRAGACEAYNLGCGGSGYTVREVIDSAARVTGRPITVTVAARRPGDPAMLVASSSRIRADLGWTPRFQDLDPIISSAWAWLERHAPAHSEAPNAVRAARERL